ncbi:unnamed protein product [Echinostoma caproni]|uniref:Kelch repeat protein n=1 Tax=Echinostoma caproni TaxID=27848 RepID=A0A183B7B5_9TREM|nr:unnamed protein product [Echinostoma caproni]
MLKYVGLAVVNNQLIAIGGFDGATYLKTVELYDPEANCWLLRGSMNSRRLGGGVGVVRLANATWNLGLNSSSIGLRDDLPGDLTPKPSGSGGMNAPPPPPPPPPGLTGSTSTAVLMMTQSASASSGSTATGTIGASMTNSVIGPGISGSAVNATTSIGNNSGPSNSGPSLTSGAGSNGAFLF